jgi:hypothetical protein
MIVKEFTNRAALVLQSVRLERLAVYHDSGSTPWYLEKAWEDMTPEEWEEVPLLCHDFYL